METAVRSGGTLVLLCTLIGKHSQLQEELGSAGCEQTVRETAELIVSCFRRSDFLARLGEAQFAALAVDAAEPSAPVIRQRVESRLAIHNQSGSRGGHPGCVSAWASGVQTTPGPSLSFSTP